VNLFGIIFVVVMGTLVILAVAIEYAAVWLLGVK